MKKIGFVTAGGKGSRWGNFYKELLPVGDEIWLLDRAVARLQRKMVDQVIVITTPEKVGTHAKHLQGKTNGSISFVMQEGEEFWGAIRTACKYAGDINLLTMADTLPSLDCFDFKYKNYNFGLGTFFTDTPERFGVLLREEDGSTRVVDKLKADPPAEAWGTFWFDGYIADKWFWSRTINNYTDAINFALENSRAEIHRFENYYDMANFSAYKEYLTGGQK